MKIFVLTALIYGAACEIAFVKQRINPQRGRIIGGEEVQPHSYPFVVGLWINGNSFCAGSLLSLNYVLTAGHCGIVIRSVRVVLGAHNLNRATEENQISIAGSRVVLHEDYDDYYLYNDIALIQLAEVVVLSENIKLASLPNSALSYGSGTAQAVGWGLTRDVPFPTTGDISEILLSVEVPLIDVDECSLYYNDEDEIFVKDQNICTSGYKNKGTCDGDSGGPLVQNGTVIGITSFGTVECEACNPSVYTNVGDYLDWIVYNSDLQ